MITQEMIIGKGMDEMDLAIVECLETDARMPCVGIAKVIGVTEATVRRRLERMRNDGVLEFAVGLDAAVVGRTVGALVLLEASPDRVGQVIDDLGQISHVSGVFHATGRCNVVAWVWVASLDALWVTLREEVGAVPGVLRLEVMMLDTHAVRHHSL